MKLIPTILIITCTVIITFFVTQAYIKNPVDYSNSIDLSNNIKDGFTTNEKFINGLYQDLDLNNPEEVFRYVFSRLEKEVIIYPTENYYYFNFPMHGKIIWGSISLFANNRDNGVLDMGYIEKIDKTQRSDFSPVGGGSNFTEKDGVLVKKIDDFKYSVTYEGKTVIFRINDIGLTPPKNLPENESFVGPSFDESGLKFFLMFNNTEQKLFWVLNEDNFVPEGFTNYNGDIVIGNRTEFAFYVDKKNNRKILIGVEGLNVLQNNWYDGPFDQMPDNYVYTEKIELKKYIEANYPEVAGRIDKYGNYIDEEGARIAIAPYMVYFSKEDLNITVDACKSESAFYSCITQQVFNVPDTYYDIPLVGQDPNVVSNISII